VKIKRILVPTDFSASSRKALAYALNFARSQGAEIVLVHVIETLNYMVPRYVPEPRVLLAELRREATQQLLDIEQKARRRYPRVRSEVHFGVVYETIGDLARKLHADLIIIATHGRTGFAHMLMGSVTERVVRLAPCPVLSVRTLPLRPARRAAKLRARP
jgi:nucleotide-binding universal stress UspA family protein